jgi:hypothetical protein
MDQDLPGELAIHIRQPRGMMGVIDMQLDLDRIHGQIDQLPCFSP